RPRGLGACLLRLELWALAGGEVPLRSRQPLPLPAVAADALNLPGRRCAPDGPSRNRSGMSGAGRAHWEGEAEAGEDGSAWARPRGTILPMDRGSCKAGRARTLVGAAVSRRVVRARVVCARHAITPAGDACRGTPSGT